MMVWSRKLTSEDATFKMKLEWQEGTRPVKFRTMKNKRKQKKRSG